MPKLCVCVLVLFLVLNVVVSFSTVVPSYTRSTITPFFKPNTHCNLEINAKNRRRGRGGSENGDEMEKKGYVPSGLTAAEYATIKKEEADGRAKLNFGMWGPRFSQTSAPGGDWMTDSMLWTNGYQYDTVSVNGDKNGKSMPRPPLVLLPFLYLIAYSRRFAPAFLGVFVPLQLIHSGVFVARSTLSNTVISSMMKELMRGAFTGKAVALNGFIGLGAKFSIAVLFAPLVDSFVMERLNRYQLWSRTRTASYAITTTFVAFLLVTFIRLVIRS